MPDTSLCCSVPIVVADAFRELAWKRSTTVSSLLTAEVYRLLAEGADEIARSVEVVA